MTTKGDMGVFKKAMVVCRLERIDRLLFSIIIRVCFMYNSYLV